MDPLCRSTMDFLVMDTIPDFKSSRLTTSFSARKFGIGRALSGMSLAIRANMRLRAPTRIEIWCIQNGSGAHRTGLPKNWTKVIWPKKVMAIIIQNSLLLHILTKGLSYSFLRVLALIKLNIWRNTKQLKKKVKCCPLMKFQLDFTPMVEGILSHLFP